MNRLCDDHAVERIAMKSLELFKCKELFSIDRQYPNFRDAEQNLVTSISQCCSGQDAKISFRRRHPEQQLCFE